MRRRWRAMARCWSRRGSKWSPARRRARRVAPHSLRRLRSTKAPRLRRAASACGPHCACGIIQVLWYIRHMRCRSVPYSIVYAVQCHIHSRALCQAHQTLSLRIACSSVPWAHLKSAQIISCLLLFYNLCSSQTPGYCVAYVGNIAFEATEADLRAVFEGLAVPRVRMHTDAVSGRFKGYAHVHFSDEASLDSCDPWPQSFVVALARQTRRCIAGR